MIDYNRSAVLTKMQELDARRQAERDADPTVASAQKTLASAQHKLEEEEDGAAHPDRDRRWAHWTQGQRLSVRSQWGERVAQAKQAVADAEQGLRTAEGAHIRTRYLAGLEAKKAEQQAARDAEQANFAAEQEAQAKEQFRGAYLASGGTSEQFEAAWPGMWRKELATRTLARGLN